jgi:general secretion pathway protein G
LRKRFNHKMSGMTLLELLVAASIFAAISGFSALRIRDFIQETKKASAEAALETISLAILSMRSDTGKYPQELSDLTRTSMPGYLSLPARYWNGPYIPPKIILDPWGEEFIYELVSEGEASEDEVFGPFVFSTGNPGQGGSAFFRGPGRDDDEPRQGAGRGRDDDDRGQGGNNPGQGGNNPGQGGGHQYEETFTFEASAGPGELIIENTENPVTNGKVTINGIEVASPSDFNPAPHKSLVIKELNLQETNTITIELSGAPSREVIISVKGQISVSGIELQGFRLGCLNAGIFITKGISNE